MSRAAAQIAARIEELPEASIRRKVLEGARRFKSSWMELGKLLTQVKRESLWREWGHPSFDAYCAKELFIRKGTADKLTMSYGFLERHEPELAEARPARAGGAAPAFEVIEVLSRAEAAGRFDGARWADLRDDALDARSATAVSRQLSEKLGPAPRPPSPDEGERLRRLAGLARRLATACAQEGAIPEPMSERAGVLADDLAALLEGQ